MPQPDAAQRDAAVRQRLIEHLSGLIGGSDAWSKRRREEFVGYVKGKPGLRRLLRRTKTGLLRIDHAAAQREAHDDGKWLLRTSDLTLITEDLAAAYKQLLAVKRGWRDAKSSLGLRPLYHHREDRIRAHAQLCWLALLLIRVAETRTGDAWRNLRHALDRMHLVTFATADGRVAQGSILTTGQKTILAALDLPEPPKYLDFTPGTGAASPTDQPARIPRAHHLRKSGQGDLQKSGRGICDRRDIVREPEAAVGTIRCRSAALRSPAPHRCGRCLPVSPARSP
ncbi:hypothetical protein MSM1_19035 [Mycobacterium sp. SM1]|uniref:IS1634 family transposase n=1 Tax=Mycobacterium sp. SM1 TaxID=2816243 RepID=UPI001BD05C3C|nr:hypothetical protein [Mycobacterium sp. SM1]MBS4730328.1 hypothetical protein [Mycobacterium sp. SM1]